MNEQNNIEMEALLAARDFAISSLIYRNESAKALDLNLSESLCLTYIAIKGQLSPSELARIIGLKTGSITTLLDRLEKMNFVLRRQSSTDRRKLYVELTEEYKSISFQRVQKIQAAHKDLISRFTQEELQLIVRFLNGFTSNLSKDSADVRDFYGEK